MSHVHDKAIAEAETKLVALIAEAKGIPGLFPRVELWVARMCAGKKLSEFLHDESVEGRTRVTVAKALVEILLKPDHDRLPKVGEETPPTPAPAPTPVEETEPPAPDHLRDLVKREVRLQLASTLETIAKVLRETA